MAMAYKDVNITLSNFVFPGCVAFIQAFGHEKVPTLLQHKKHQS